MQNRDGDLSEFFVHEIQSFPPSRSDFGKLHLQNTKSDLLECIEDSDQPEPPSIYDCNVLAIIVHCLPTTSVSTFHEDADRIFIPYREKQLRLSQDWMLYGTHTYRTVCRNLPVKREARVCAEKCRKMSGETKLPRSPMNFLRDPMNKRELFVILTVKIEEFNWSCTKAVYITSGEVVLYKG